MGRGCRRARLTPIITRNTLHAIALGRSNSKIEFRRVDGCYRVHLAYWSLPGGYHVSCKLVRSSNLTRGCCGVRVCRSPHDDGRALVLNLLCEGKSNRTRIWALGGRGIALAIAFLHCVRLQGVSNYPRLVRPRSPRLTNKNYDLYTLSGNNLTVHDGDMRSPRWETRVSD